MKSFRLFASCGFGVIVLAWAVTAAGQMQGIDTEALERQYQRTLVRLENSAAAIEDYQAYNFHWWTGVTFLVGMSVYLRAVKYLNDPLGAYAMATVSAATLALIGLCAPSFGLDGWQGRGLAMRQVGGWAALAFGALWLKNYLTLHGKPAETS